MPDFAFGAWLRRRFTLGVERLAEWRPGDEVACFVSAGGLTAFLVEVDDVFVTGRLSTASRRSTPSAGLSVWLTVDGSAGFG